MALVRAIGGQVSRRIEHAVRVRRLRRPRVTVVIPTYNWATVLPWSIGSVCAQTFADWEWCVTEAERAFAQACLLVGKRVLRGMLVEDLPGAPPITRH